MELGNIVRKECLNECPVGFISDFKTMSCVHNYRYCVHQALSADGKKCVSCTKNQFIDIESRICSTNCENLSLIQQGQHFCVKQCPPDSFEDTEKKICKVDASKCKFGASVDEE